MVLLILKCMCLGLVVSLMYIVE